MIEYHKLIIRGYKSIEYCKIDFNNLAPVTLIKGKTGSGKSTLIESIYWCLFGLNLKGLNAASVKSKVPSIKSTLVSLFFMIGDNIYEVHRGHNYKACVNGLEVGSNVMLYKNFELVRTKGNTDTTNMIVELLGIPPRLYLSSILFRQRSLRLAELENKEVKEIFDLILERVYDLNVIDELSEKASNKISELTTQNISLKSRLDNKIYELENRQRYHENIKRLYDDHEVLVSRDIKNAKTKIAELNIELKECEKDLVNLDIVEIRKDKKELKEEINSYEKELLPLIRQRDEINADITFLESEVKYKECSRCGQPLSKVNDKKIKIKKALKSITNLTNQIETIKEDLKDAEEDALKVLQDFNLYFEQQEDLKEKELIEQKITAQHQIINSAKKRRQPKSELNKSIREKKKIKIQIKELEKQHIEIEGELKRLQWWSKNAFGAGGIKNYLFNSILENVNLNLLNYTAAFNILVHLSMAGKVRKKLEINLVKDDADYIYNELSGGEKALLDLSFAFAINDLFTKQSSNLIFFDEYFEGVDQECLQLCMDLIRSKSEKVKVLLITHSDRLDILGTDLIEVVKENKISYIK